MDIFMSRKLMFLINPRGKTPEEFKKAASEALKKYNETGEITIDIEELTKEWEQKLKVKAKKLGLVKCEICGEYKSKPKTKANVLCDCSDIVCTKCKVNKTRRPISNHFSAIDGSIWHTPYFLHLCKNCR
jgi:formylmethanofuran dehydrogenase subunit E